MSWTSMLFSKSYRLESSVNVPRIAKPYGSKSWSTKSGTDILTCVAANLINPTARGRDGHSFGGHNGKVEALGEQRLFEQRQKNLLFQ